MEFLQSAVAFIIVIGVLVFVHELGHFLAAIWTGMRADVFALGMGPRVVGWNRITGLTFGKLPQDLELGEHTDFRLCALPIGGYVKILGMVDESMDTDFAGQPPQPYEFRSKKNWQKALVLSAGVIMNFLLAIAVFTAFFIADGEVTWNTTRIAYVEPMSVMSRAGVRADDRVLAIDTAQVSSWQEVEKNLALSSATGNRFMIVERNGERVTLPFFAGDVMKAITEKKGLGISPSDVRVSMGNVITLGPAGTAGVQTGDVVLAVDSTAVRSLGQFQSYVKGHAGKTIKLHVDRGGQPRPIDVKVNGEGKIMVELRGEYTGPESRLTYGPIEALSRGVEQTSATVVMIGTSVAHIVKGSVGVRESFGGPIRIAEMAGQSSERGIRDFIAFMALISISLGVMNLLPLPGLDGGHLVFVGIESIIRREIPTTVKIRFQQVGIALLLLLMVFVFYLDLTR